MAAVVLITGANRGIGLEVARQLAAKGLIVIAGVRNPAKMKLKDVKAINLDVCDDASIQAAAREVKARHGHLDVLINNAGILLAEEDTQLLGLGMETVRKTFETNTLGPLRMVQAFVPLMKQGGRIINVSSGGGQLSSPSTWSPAYCLSKTALNGLTVQLATALKGRIAVNSVCPGWVRTDMGGASAPCSVQEGADTILWLATEAPFELSGGFFRDRKSIPW